MNTERDNKKEQPQIHVDIGVSSTGRDFIVSSGNVTTGDSGNIATTQSIKVRGIETTQIELNKLLEAFEKLESAISASDLNADEKEAAQHNVKDLREQMTSFTEKKANDHILTASAEALFKYGPAITGALVAAFTTPLGGAITMAAGTKALEFYKNLRQKYPTNFDVD